MGTGRGVVVALTVAVALVLIGCGDSSESISKEEFIAKADAICKESSERMATGFSKRLKDAKKLVKPQNAELEKLVGDVMVPNIEREIEELRALGIPAGDEERVEAMIEALEEGVEVAERNPQAVTVSSDAVFGIAARIAAEYGLEVCGNR